MIFWICSSVADCSITMTMNCLWLLVSPYSIHPDARRGRKHRDTHASSAGRIHQDSALTGVNPARAVMKPRLRALSADCSITMTMNCLWLLVSPYSIHPDARRGRKHRDTHASSAGRIHQDSALTGVNPARAVMKPRLRALSADCSITMTMNCLWLLVSPYSIHPDARRGRKHRDTHASSAGRIHQDSALTGVNPARAVMKPRLRALSADCSITMTMNCLWLLVSPYSIHPDARRGRKHRDTHASSAGRIHQDSALTGVNPARAVMKPRLRALSADCSITMTMNCLWLLVSPYSIHPDARRGRKHRDTHASSAGRIHQDSALTGVNPARAVMKPRLRALSADCSITMTMNCLWLLVSPYSIHPDARRGRKHRDTHAFSAGRIHQDSALTGVNPARAVMKPRLRALSADCSITMTMNCLWLLVSPCLIHPDARRGRKHRDTHASSAGRIHQDSALTRVNPARAVMKPRLRALSADCSITMTMNCLWLLV